MNWLLSNARASVYRSLLARIAYLELLVGPPQVGGHQSETGGASRECTSKAMASFMAQGLITYSRRTVTVVDLAG